jgi:hypothetical protein
MFILADFNIEEGNFPLHCRKPKSRLLKQYRQATFHTEL